MKGGLGTTKISTYVQEMLQLDEGAEELLSGIISKEVCLMHLYSLYSFLQEKLREDEFEDAPLGSREKLTVCTCSEITSIGNAKEGTNQSIRAHKC